MLFSILIYVGVILVVIKLLAVLTAARCRSNVCLVGKTAIVTGGNLGLGLALVKALAARGCRVIIVDKDDAQETVRSVIKETHNPNISSEKVDLSQLDKVRELAKRLNTNLDELHILVNNAGMVSSKDGKTAFTVNYFSHFLLTHLLIDKLIKSASSRIISASSLAAYLTPFLEPGSKDFFDPELSYQYSKLAMAISSKTFAAKLKEVGVTSNCFHPGCVRTDLWGPLFSFDYWNLNICRFYLALIIATLFGKTVEEGIQTTLHLAVADEVENQSGKFFIDCISCYQPNKVNDEEFCRKFWNYSEQFVGLTQEEKLDFVIKKYINK